MKARQVFCNVCKRFQLCSRVCHRHRHTDLSTSPAQPLHRWVPLWGVCVSVCALCIFLFFFAVLLMLDEGNWSVGWVNQCQYGWADCIWWSCSDQMASWQKVQNWWCVHVDIIVCVNSNFFPLVILKIKPKLYKFTRSESVSESVRPHPRTKEDLQFSHTSNLLLFSIKAQKEFKSAAWQLTRNTALVSLRLKNNIISNSIIQPNFGNLICPQNLKKQIYCWPWISNIFVYFIYYTILYLYNVYIYIYMYYTISV